MEQNSKIEKTAHLAVTDAEGSDTTSSTKTGAGAYEIDELLVEILGDDYQDKTEYTKSRDNYITGSKELDDLVETILGKGWEEGDSEPVQRRASDYTQKELDELIESILGEDWEMDDEQLASPPDSAAMQTGRISEVHASSANQSKPLPPRTSKTTLPQTRHVIKNQSIEVPQEANRSRPILQVLIVLVVIIGAIGIWKYSISTNDNTTMSVEQVSAPTDQNTMTTTESLPTTEPSDQVTQPVATTSTSEIGHFATEPEITTAPLADEDTLAMTIPVAEDVQPSIAEQQGSADEDMISTTIPVKEDIEPSITEQEGIADDDMPTITFTVEEDNEPNIIDQEDTVHTKAPTQEVIIYTIVKGDTFWSIAGRFVKNPYKYLELAEQNNITDPTLIHPGNKIRIIMVSK